MYDSNDGVRGHWAGFEKDDWRKSGLRSMLRGRGGVRKTLDVTTYQRAGNCTHCQHPVPSYCRNVSSKNVNSRLLEPSADVTSRQRVVCGMGGPRLQ